MVSGRGFPGEEEGARRHAKVGVGSQAVVENHDVQSVEQLPLVFVNAFDLAVDDGIGVDGLAGGALKPVGKTHLGVARGLAKNGAKSGILGMRLESGEMGEVGDPMVSAEGIGDGMGQFRHANLFRGAFLDQAHALHAVLIAGILLANGVEETAVDLVDDFEMARDDVLEPGHRPLLQRLR